MSVHGKLPIACPDVVRLVIADDERNQDGDAHDADSASQAIGLDDAQTSHAVEAQTNTVVSQSSSRRTTTDEVLDGLLAQTARPADSGAASAAAASALSSRQHSVSSTSIVQQALLSKAPDAAQGRSTVDSVLEAVLGQVAALDSDAASHTGSLSAGSASVNSLLDTVLQEAAEAVHNGLTAFDTAHGGQSIAVPAGNMRTTVDSVLDEVLDATAQGGLRDATDQFRTFDNPLSGPSNSLDTCAVNYHLRTAADCQHNSAALPQPRTTSDTVLDAVLAEVADIASCKRTTADSVLDAVLTDVSSSSMGNVGSHVSVSRAANPHASDLEEAQDNGYASQVCNSLRSGGLRHVRLQELLYSKSCTPHHCTTQMHHASSILGPSMKVSVFCMTS